jgi:hypothetical protein
VVEVEHGHPSAAVDVGEKATHGLAGRRHWYLRPPRGPGRQWHVRGRVSWWSLLEVAAWSASLQQLGGMLSWRLGAPGGAMWVTENAAGSRMLAF